MVAAGSIALFLALLFAAAVTFPSAVQGASGRYGYGAVGTLAALLATAAFLRGDLAAWRSAGLIGDSRSHVRLAVGTAIGLGLMAAILATIYMLCGIRPQWSDGLTAAVLVPLGALPALALMEEIAFRGLPFARLRQAYGLWAAQIAIAVAFAAYHLLNGWTLLGALVGPGAWAFVFGIAAARSGGVALPTGVHFGINLGQALVGLGIAGGGPSMLELVDPDGLTGDVLAQRMTMAGLVAQAFILAGALWLTRRLAARER